MTGLPGAAPVTALWTALIALLMLGLMLRVVQLRLTRRIGIGDGGDKELAKAIRVHGNATETLPIALLLMLVLELGGGSPTLLHVSGTTLLIGRLAHAWGLSRSSGASIGRQLGSLTWMAVVVVLALTILTRSL